VSDLGADVLEMTVRLAAAGDEVAFARIVAAHRDEMVRVAFVVCGDRDLAQDAAQAALWIAWRRLPGLRDPDRLRPWLLKVTINEGRQLMRRRRRVALMELDETVASGAVSGSRDTLAEMDLARALAGLGAEDRAIVALRFVADLDSSEIGPIVGLSASGVRSRLARTLERLRRELADG
jgi:RNA polymerase sigma-70 factor (ECF subfamily)